MDTMQDLDQPVYQRNHLSVRFLQLVGVSLLWSLTSLPIVTLGPSCCALYRTSVTVIRQGHGKLLETFFRTFRSHFRRSLLSGIGILVLGAMLLFCLAFSGTLGGERFFWRVLSYAYVVLLVLLGCFAVCRFPLISAIRLRGWKDLAFSCVFALRHLFTAFTCLLVWYLGAQIVIRLPAMGIILPAVCSLVCSLVLEPLVARYAGAEE